MNREYAVLYNRSLERLFGGQARATAKALNAECRYTDELTFLPDEQIHFRKCVYFDKDVVTGLRLEGLGVKLYNNIGSIELCDDKRRTCQILKHDLRLPRTVSAPLLFSETEELQNRFAEQAADTLGFPMVAKLAFGSLGEQVRLIRTPEELRNCCRAWSGKPYLLQEFIASSAGRDLRIYVVNGKAEAAMERYNPDDFRSNIGAGGHGKKVVPPDDYVAAAVDACAFLGLHFAGVDLLYGADGAPYLCEVNSNALCRTLNRVCGVSIEEKIAQTVLEDI